MTQLEASKKITRRNMRRYKQHAHNSKWKLIIDETHTDYQKEYPGKALILQEVFISGKARHRRRSYQSIADSLNYSLPTINMWIDEIVQEIMLRAAKERLL
jgi:hypothetical protein